MRVFSMLGAVSAVSAVALCGACSGGIFPAPFASDPAPADTPLASAGPAFLRLGALRWVRGDQPLLDLAPNGVLRDRDNILGTLGADGSFTSRDKSRSFTMTPDGLVHVAPGFDLQIAEDGTAVSRVHGEPDDTVTLEQVARPRNGNPGMRIEGISPPLRRTAMWILMIPDLLHLLSEPGQ